MRKYREIEGVIIHCSATPKSMNIGAKEIDQWHRARGWSGIGYHYVINRKGKIELGRSVNKQGAHTRGHNRGTIGICMVGGVTDDKKTPENNFTNEQFEVLGRLLDFIQDTQEKELWIKGHNEFSDKACPSFNVQEWLIGRRK